MNNEEELAKLSSGGKDGPERDSKCGSPDIKTEWWEGASESKREEAGSEG